MRNFFRAVFGIILAALFLAIALAAQTVIYRSPAPAKPDIDVASAGATDGDRVAMHLGEAVRFETVSHQDPSGDDPAPFEAMRDWLERSYPDFHRAAKREIVGGGALLYSWTGSDPNLAPIILMAHYDVVPVAEDSLDQWKAKPFGGQIVEGAVYGRGAIDDKGSLIPMMEALDDAARAGLRPKRTILVVSGNDEEVSGKGAGAIAALLETRHVMADFVLDEGEVVITDFPVTNKPVALVGVAEKGYGTLRVTAPAPGGHSSAPPPVTGIETLARAILAITAKPFELKLDGPNREMLKTLAPEAPFPARVAMINDWLFEPLLIREIAKSPAGAASLHTTIAPTMLQGSPKENVLPMAPSALINYRIGPDDTADSVIARARQAVGDLPVEIAWNTPPRDPSPASSTSSRGYRVIAALSADLYHVPTAPALVNAGTDSRQMIVVAKDVYRFAPVELALRDVVMIHGVNEHIKVAALAKALEFYRRLIATVAMN